MLTKLHEPVLRLKPAAALVVVRKDVFLPLGKFAVKWLVAVSEVLPVKAPCVKKIPKCKKKQLV